MAKFKLSSWLHPSSGSTNSVERKKNNRRSFSAFSSVPALRHKASNHSAINGDVSAKEGKPATISEESSTAEPTYVSRMGELAAKISTETAKLEGYFKENDMPIPSFDVDSPADFPKLPADIQQSRNEILFATAELQRLVRGPRETVRWTAWGFLDVLALQIVNNYNLAALVPEKGTISLTDLGAQTPLDKINLARTIRYAITNNIFTEPSPNQIAHTAASLALKNDKSLVDWVGFNTEDIFPASAHVLEAIKTHPEATSLTRTGFNVAFDTVDKEPMFMTFGKDPARAKRMGGAMASLTGGEGYEVHRFVDGPGGYDFSDVDAKVGTFVDVGGSHGFVCVDLAKKWRNMKFVCQDLPRTVQSAPKPLCKDDGQVDGRIEMMAHDFFTEQVVEGADVYFFRWILHNYSTPYAVKILKNLVPALKPGAKILINDHCLRAPGSETPWDDRLMRGMDLVMLTLLNAQERDEEEFRELFKAASDGYEFVGVKRAEGCRMSVIEAVWRPWDVNGEIEEAKEEETVKKVEEDEAKVEEVKAAEELVKEEVKVEEPSQEEVKAEGEEAKAEEKKE